MVKHRTKYFCIDCKRPVSDYRVKRCKSCAAKEVMRYRKISGKDNPMYGRTGKNNPNYKNGVWCKIHKCKDCKKRISIVSYFGLGRCKSCSKKGKLNNEYINGKSCNPYPSEFTHKLRSSIRKRDNYTCQNPECNLSEKEHIRLYGKILHVHHIDYNKENCKLKNLISLCVICNILANKNRKFWKKLYKRIIKRIYE